MSAINPASFASPTLGIQAPSGVGPGAVSAGRGVNNERRQNQMPPEQQQPHAFPSGAQARGYRSGFNQPVQGVDRQPAPGSGYPPSNYAYAPVSFANGRVNGSYLPGGLTPGMEQFTGNGYPQAGDFQAMRHRFPTPQNMASPSPHSQGVSPISQNDWTAAFQGLSLNTH